MVYRYDRVAIDHISRRFFSTRKTCEARVSTLVRFRYLRAVRLPVLGPRGSGKWLLWLAVRGRAFLARELGGSPRQFPRLQVPASPAHHLAVCSTRLHFELSCPEHGVTVEDWLTDRACHARYRFPIPDGEFVLRGRGKAQGFRLEVDLGTQSASKLKQKLAAYMKQDDERPVLWVVPTDRRLGHLVRYAEELAAITGLDATKHMMTIASEHLALIPWRVPTRKETYVVLPS